jgi:iron(III) transport system ATP-binding protein
LRDLDLDVEEGSFVSILGPSGSGKTTLLRVIAGFDRADSGSLSFGDWIVDDSSNFVEPNLRRVGYVPQDGSLFPHLSVAANVGFGLARRDRNGRKVAELLEMVGLGGLAARYPHQLSGGQQQRVALARGLAIEPDLVLLDEPFSSLDASLRATVRNDVRRILKDAGTTAILVTHDQDEALSLADKVAIIHEGYVSQCDSPERLYAHPSTPLLANELGDVNFVDGTAHHESVDTVFGRLPLATSSAASIRAAEGTPLLVLIRPEQIMVNERPGDLDIIAHVVRREFYGHDAIVQLRTERGDGNIVTVRIANPTDLPTQDARVGLEIRGTVVAWPSDVKRDGDSIDLA